MTPPDPPSSPSPDPQYAKKPEPAQPVPKIRVEHRVAYDDQVKPVPRDLPVIKREVEPKLPEIESVSSTAPRMTSVPIPPIPIDNQQVTAASAIVVSQTTKQISSVKVVLFSLLFVMLAPCLIFMYLLATCKDNFH